MSELIYVDESGNETKRVTKGRGRPPAGAVKQDDGNFIVSPVTEKVTRFVPEYVTLDESGTEVGTRVAKGRGRPKPGYTKVTQGVLAGHWVKTAEAVVAPEATTETVVAPEAPEATTETVVGTEEVTKVETPVSA